MSSIIKINVHQLLFFASFLLLLQFLIYNSLKDLQRLNSLKNLKIQINKNQTIISISQKTGISSHLIRQIINRQPFQILNLYHKSIEEGLIIIESQKLELISYKYFGINIELNISMKQKQEKAYIAPSKGLTKFKHFAMKQEVLKLLEQSNFKRPTVVQAQSLPITLQENLKQLCVIVYAYNGAGKTLTYLIPVLNSLEMIPFETSQKARGAQQDKKKSQPQALIVFPTEALMSQVYEYLESYANYYEATFKWPLKIGRIYGNILEHGHIIVGLTQKVCSNLSNLDVSELKWVIFDECDKIKDDSLDLFKQMLVMFSAKKIKSNFLITSATGEKQKFRSFISSNLTSHNLVELDSKQQNMGLKGVTHYYSNLAGQDRLNSIMRLLQILSKKEEKVQVIIFFNEIRQLENFYQLLLKERDRFLVNDPQADAKGKSNINVDYIHARCGVCKGPHNHPDDCSRTKTKRVTRLRNGQIQILLGTETIGRGIDIRTVSLVINYSEPTKNKGEVSSITYIHRVGRTGRYSDEGIGLTFIDGNDGGQFVKITQKEQNISFQKMESEQKIVEQALLCSKKNIALGEDSKHRYEKDD